MTERELLRQLVDALDKELPHNMKHIAAGQRFNARIALAQPEQEPVEWGVDWGPDGNSVSIIKRLADGSIEVVGWEYAPHPPQRTWVGLTDEDIEKVCGFGEYTTTSTRITFTHLSKAIEAKLKEKNS